MTELLLVIAFFLLIGLVLLVLPRLLDRAGREARRIAQEQLVAQWQIRQVMRQAQQQMREAVRRELP